MDDYSEDGNAFAIPDLWKTSSLADFSQGSTEPIALQLEPLGIPLSPDLRGCSLRVLTGMYNRTVECPRAWLRHSEKL